MLQVTRGHAPRVYWLPDYKQPILIEILAEFHVGLDSLDTRKFLDLVSKVSKKAGGDLEFETRFGTESAAVSPAELSARPWAKIWWPNRDRRAQLTQGIVIANLVGTYPGSAAFQEHASDLLAMSAEVLGPVRCRSVRFQTVDQFDVPARESRLGSYLTAEDGRLPTAFLDTSSTADISVGDGLLAWEGWNRSLTVRVRRLPDSKTMRVLLESIFHEQRAESEPPYELMERLRRKSVLSFESLITDLLRVDVMGGPRS